MAIRNLRTMSDATLAVRMVDAKRAVNAATEIMDEIAGEIRNRETFGTVEVNACKVTRSDARESVILDTDKAKTLIPNWELVCSKVSKVKASVRVTFG